MHSCRVASAVILALALSACGGGGGAAAQPDLTMTTGERIQALIASGDLPKLDASATIAGVDADNNGIRDDIDALIAGKNLPTVQSAAVKQEAKAVQAALLVNTGDKAAVTAAARQVSRALNCVFHQFDADTATTISSAFEKFTVNTKERVVAYDAYNKALNGTILSSPKGVTCD